LAANVVGNANCANFANFVGVGVGVGDDAVFLTSEVEKWLYPDPKRQRPERVEGRKSI